MLETTHPQPTSHSDASGSVARQVAAAIRDTLPAPFPTFAAAPVDDARDHIPDQILSALRRPRIRVFEIGAAAVVGAAGIEGRVRLRIDHQRWSLATIEASILAILLQVEPDLRGSDRFAAAFRLAAVMAEQKVAQVHAWSHQIRPTTDIEDDGVAA